jgi:long-subunit fatty acid transport protein
MAVDENTGLPIIEPDGSFQQVDNEDFMDHNTWELGLGLEYMFSDMIGISVGYLKVNSGANDKYQSDISYSLSTNTVGGGFVINIGELLQVNLGFDYVMYQKSDVALTETLGENVIPYTTTYEKSTTVLGVGVDLNF